MESINELLEKYFRGESTLSEENELKRYFLSDNIEDSHLVYRPLFQVFDEESHLKMQPQNDKIIPVNPYNNKRKWFQIISLSGVAATLLLFIWFFRFNSESADYVVIKGKRINNSEFAQQLAQTKMSEINSVLVRNFKPMESIQTVKKNLGVMRKLSDMKLNNEKNENN